MYHESLEANSFMGGGGVTATSAMRVLNDRYPDRQKHTHTHTDRTRLMASIGYMGGKGPFKKFNDSQKRKLIFLTPPPCRPL